MGASWVAGQLRQSDGTIYTGCKVYVYAAGTSTPSTIYTDAGLATPDTNPHVADALGKIDFYLDDSASYKITVKTSDDATTLYSQDNIAVSDGVILTLFNLNDSSLIAQNIGDITAVSEALTDGSIDDAAAAPAQTEADKVAAAASATAAANSAGSVAAAVDLADDIVTTSQLVLSGSGIRYDFAIRDANDRITSGIDENGQMYQTNQDGTDVEKVLTQGGIDDRVRLTVDNNGPDVVDENGTRWKIAFMDANNRIYGGMVEITEDTYQWKLATPTGLKDVSSDGSSETITYEQDATSLDHVRTDDNYILIVIIDGQSNADGINIDSDTINYSAAETDGSEEYVLKPSVGIRPEGVSFTELVPMFEDGAKTNTQESSLSSICYSLHKRINTLHSHRLRIAGFVSAQTAQTVEELSRGSDYYDNYLAACEDMATVCTSNGWKPEIVMVKVHGEANSDDKAADYCQKRETDYRQRTDDIKRIFGLKSEILQVSIQTNAGQVRDPDDSDWAPKEAPIGTHMLTERTGWARCAGPIFQFEHSSDDLHLSCDGQADMGLAIQDVIYHELFSHGWVDWKPHRAVWTSTTVCDVYWEAPYPELALNGDSVIDMTGSTETTSGFQAHDYAGNLASISSVAIASDKAGDDVITRFTFGSAVTSNLWIEMGRRKDGSGSNGPANGGRHILRTTQSLTGEKTSNTVYQRAPCMQFFIGRP